MLPKSIQIDSLHITWSLHHTHTQKYSMTLIQHRCRERQLLRAPACPSVPRQPLKLSSPATDLPTWCRIWGLTRSQPEVIRPQAFFSAIVLFLTPTSCCEYFPSRQWRKLTDPRNHLLWFLLWLPFCLIPGRTGHPLWGIQGIASCSPLPPPQIQTTSLGNF